MKYVLYCAAHACVRAYNMGWDEIYIYEMKSGMRTMGVSLTGSGGHTQESG